MRGVLICGLTVPAKNRSPILQDRSLCGAYQLTTSSWVEKHCYAKGIVVWHRNEGVRDDDTHFHPGQGEILPVDGHPDAPFGLDRQNITLVQVDGK